MKNYSSLWWTMMVVVGLACPASLPAATLAVDPVISSRRVTFVPRYESESFRIEVFDLSGKKLFDSGVVAGRAINWDFRDPLGQRVAEGMYRYVVTLRDRFGKDYEAQAGDIAVDRRLQPAVEAPGLERPIKGFGTRERIPKWTDTDAIADSVIAESNGNIGIGTTSPGAVLHVLGIQPPLPAGGVDGIDAEHVLRIVGGKGGNAGGAPGSYGGTGAEIIIQAGDGGDTLKGVSTRGGRGGSIMFKPGAGGLDGGNPSGSTGDVLIAPSGGLVGVGTSSPSHRLHVHGGGNFFAGDHPLISADAIAIGYRADGTQAVAGIAHSLSGVPMILGTSNSPDSVVILNSGKVGIGTTNPGSKLTAAGEIHSTSGGFKFPDGTVQTTAALGRAWLLSGNAGTDPKFLGTLDNQSLDLVVNSSRAMRYEPNTTSPNLIGGISAVSPGVAGAAIGGGGFFLALPTNIVDDRNKVFDDFGTVGGGRKNWAGNTAGTTSDQPFATVGGGNNNKATGSAATIAGGDGNSASGVDATVGGGSNNSAGGQNATISGGFNNTASGANATISGGLDHIASNKYATISGGRQNSATAEGSAVGGGFTNVASNLFATIAGGGANTASGNSATIGGGDGNSATGQQATIVGGRANTADGIAATVGGGSENQAAGHFSFAAGTRARIAAAHSGTFLFADNDANNLNYFHSVAANEFAARATGGVRFVTAINAITGAPTSGVELAAGSGSWSSMSDRNAKTNVASVNAGDVLARLASLPIKTWNYKSNRPRSATSAQWPRISPPRSTWAKTIRTSARSTPTALRWLPFRRCLARSANRIRRSPSFAAGSHDWSKRSNRF